MVSACICRLDQVLQGGFNRQFFGAHYVHLTSTWCVGHSGNTKGSEVTTCVLGNGCVAGRLVSRAYSRIGLLR